jgi:UDP-glucuronate 4-epimerase
VIAGEKILVTGASGIVGMPLAKFLAGDNEVWGVARFADPPERAREQFEATATPPTRSLTTREELESAGVTTRSVDLGAGQFEDLPRDFTVVLHLAWMRADLAHLEAALRTNVEGAGLLLHHCRAAKAALVMSGMGVYSPSEDPWHAYSEQDPVGRAATAYAPTSPASKLGVEAVARFCARAFELPVVITRLNTVMGPPASFPGMHISAVLAGQTMVAPNDPNPHSPIHIDDMKNQLESLLDAAASPAFITNWCGDEVVTAQSWMQTASELSGREATMAVHSVPCSPTGTVADPARRRTITGPCTTTFAESFRRLYEEMTVEHRDGTP